MNVNSLPSDSLLLAGQLYVYHQRSGLEDRVFEVPIPPFSLLLSA
jgi:hypothetical protein